MKLQFQRDCFQFKVLIIQDGGEKSDRQRHLISPLSVWSLVSAAATRCQTSQMWGTDGGRARWRCLRPLSSSQSEHPLTAGRAQLRRERREAEPSDQAAITMTTGNRETWDRKTQWEVWPRNSISDWWRLRCQSHCRFKNKHFNTFFPLPQDSQTLLCTVTSVRSCHHHLYLLNKLSSYIFKLSSYFDYMRGKTWSYNQTVWTNYRCFCHHSGCCEVRVNLKYL